MSVILFTEDDMARLEGGVLRFAVTSYPYENIKYVICHSKQYRDEQQYAQLAGRGADEENQIKSVVGRLFWYLWIANKTAYALQYREEPVFFADCKNIEVQIIWNISPIKLLADLNHLRYNLYTNDGNAFLNKDYEGLFGNIIDSIKDVVIEQTIVKN